MAVLDHLIETLNANNFFFPAVSVCVVVGAVLLFTVIKWLSKSDKQDTAVSFDVDDWDNEVQGSKKTKQKKAKATTAQADSGSNTTRSKITGKQSVAAKVAAPPAKEKQAEEKRKASGKKQAASPVSSKSVQPTIEVQGEWTVAGPKKKQKTKKDGANVQESKTKDHADRQTNEAAVVKTKKSVADVAPKDIEQPHEALVDSHEREVVFGARESVYDTVAVASSQAEVVVSQPSRSSYDEPPAKNRIEEPLAVESAAEARGDEGNVESDPVGKEAKSKKSSKKKKSKVVSEPTQVTDLAVQTTTVTRSQQDDSSQLMANIPSSSVTKPKAAQLVETVHKSDSERTKVGSKYLVAEEVKVVVPDASKDVVKVATKNVVKVASKDVPAASKEAIPDSSKVVANDAPKVVANDASKGVVNDASKKTLPDASIDGPAPQLVAFDELGLTEGSADVGQPVLKKKKKARKDI